MCMYLYVCLLYVCMDACMYEIELLASRKQPRINRDIIRFLDLLFPVGYPSQFPGNLKGTEYVTNNIRRMGHTRDAQEAPFHKSLSEERRKELADASKDRGIHRLIDRLNQMKIERK